MEQTYTHIIIDWNNIDYEYIHTLFSSQVSYKITHQNVK